MEPRYALIAVLDGYFRVEPFDAERHLSRYGCTPPDITLFTEPKEVAHLRDLIIN